MSGCSLIAPALIAPSVGHTPIFEYTLPHTDDYFGIQMTYVQGSATCYGTNSIPRFTPIVQNTVMGYTKTCQFLTTTQYTGIFCTGVPVTDIPDGILTITFKGYTGAASTAPIPYSALFGPSPAARTVTATTAVTSVITQTSTVLGGYAATSTVDGGYTATTTAAGSPSSTLTVYTASTTDTHTRVVFATTAVTNTKTNTISSCSMTTPSSTLSMTPTSVSLSSIVFSAPTSSSSNVLSATSSSAAGSSSPVSSLTLTPSSSTTASTSPAVISWSPTSSSSVTSSSIASTSSSSAVAAPTCPDSDGSTFSTSEGEFIIECGIDRYDNDIGLAGSATSFASCIQACSTTSGCVDVSWNGHCYLKSGLGYPNTNSGVWGARLATFLVSSSTTLPPWAAAPATSVAAVSTVTVTTTILGTLYACTPVPTATAPVSLSCPSNNAANYTSSCGAIYAIECASDRYGADLPNGASSQFTLNDCIADCDTTPGCIDVSFVFGSPGICYKKATITDSRQNANIWGARQLSPCPTTKAKLKLHRKRLLHRESKDVYKPPSARLNKRGGIAYGPDATYYQTTGTVTSTFTVRQTTDVVATAAPSGTTLRTTRPTGATTVAGAQSGVVTTTLFTAATITEQSTSTVTTTVSATTQVTTCPAVSDWPSEFVKAAV